MPRSKDKRARPAGERDETEFISTRSQISELNSRRGVFKGQLTRFSIFLNRIDLNPNFSFEELCARLEKLDQVFLDFQEINLKIEVLSEVSQEDELIQFEDEYFRVISVAKALLAGRQGSQTAMGGQIGAAEGSRADIKVKLPPISLPNFYGSYNEWLTFRDTFLSLVHNNVNLDTIQKFIYLRSCLKGEALHIIESLETTNDNYLIAWNLIKKRYENKKLIIHTHVKSIFDLPTVKPDSYQGLRLFLDKFNKNYRALEALGEPVTTWDTLLIHILMQKLDIDTKKQWEECVNDSVSPKVLELCEFLSKRCQLFETVDVKARKPSVGPKLPTLTNVLSPKVTCVFCKQNHFNFQCTKILKMSNKELYTEVKKNKLCLNCLRPSHSQNDCNSPPCSHCGRKHHKLLHIFSKNSNNSNQELNKQAEKNESESMSNFQINHQDNNENNANLPINLHCISERDSSQVLLATVVVNVLDVHGSAVQGRALLDSGSQTSFMTSEFANKLKLKNKRFEIPIVGLNNAHNKINYKVDTTIISLHENYKRKETFLLVHKITENLPQLTFDISTLNIPINIKLCDTDCNISRPVDMLLGADMFFEVLAIGQIKLGKNKPILQKTRLGWILSGKLISIENTNSQKNLCNLNILHTVAIQNQIEKFWLVENYDNANKFLTKEEQLCENHFNENVTRNEEGRFVVGLPLNNNVLNLGKSLETATKRFYNLEKRFNNDTNLKTAYVKFMNEYESLGHLSLIRPDQLKTEHPVCYLPHHGVIKESSTTTKLRTVFDASCKTDSGISLNNCLLTGPVLQPDLFSILLNFRTHNYVFTGDIEKMYRQVLVADKDRDLQRIVWRADLKDELAHYRLNTITYGTTSASFLAVRSLIQTALDYKKIYPEASKTILQNFYMDDCLCGSDTIENAIVLKNQIIEILNSGKFPLRKFYSNEPKIIADSDQGELTQFSISDDKSCKTLGLIWSPQRDIFHFSINFDINYLSTVTKRSILSAIAKIFDPLGLVGPISVRAKLIMQKLWQYNISWDESVPNDLFTLWKQFYENLPYLHNIEIPRQVTIRDYIDIELHGFCDSSEIAFGACLYIVTVNANKERFSKLLCAKSRIAPLKTLSLPRLELCGALLLAKLANKSKIVSDLNISKKYYWCDSTIVLSWIDGESRFWKTFVSNRIAEIQELTDKSQWRHISSEQNPADIISRGAVPQQLKISDLWWLGPKFILKDEQFWPAKSIKILSEPPLPETRKPKLFNFVNTIYADQSIFEKFSDLSKLNKVFAYVLRFLHNCRNKSKLTGNLTLNETNNALNILIKMSQRNDFKDEISDLIKNRQVGKKSKTLSLSPFIKDDIIHVGGRLSNSKLTQDRKHPILLPKDHNLTNLIIKFYHEINLHASVQSTLSAVRYRYWPLHGKSCVKKIIHKCITCFKAKPTIKTPIMGNIPMARLLPARPFLKVGCDFAGPILIKANQSRCKTLTKTYICIFICFVTHAVHIELATDLSTPCFLSVLRRFAARRGLPIDIYSDNGSNFLGANRELNKVICDLKAKNVTDYLIKNDITWHFIPPRSPHFGGLWESAVKSAKFHLVRVLKGACLTFEQLYTVLCQIEAILNSRPLTPLSNDPNDLLPLTPSHFLIGDVMVAVPQRDVVPIPSNRLLLYERLQQLTQHFWRRWSAEYLHTLQPKNKWRTGTDSNKFFQIGALVILQEENLPPQQWKLGRIINVHPGNDHVIRVVTVKTSVGVFKRSVLKISVLPIDL